MLYLQLVCPIFLYSTLSLIFHLQPQKDMNTLEDAGIVSRARICKGLKSPEIDSRESIPPGLYVAWRAGTITLILLGS